MSASPESLRTMLMRAVADALDGDRDSIATRLVDDLVSSGSGSASAEIGIEVSVEVTLDY